MINIKEGGWGEAGSVTHSKWRKYFLRNLRTLLKQIHY